MSISFTSNHPTVTNKLIIGGKDDAFTGNETGGYGPFPTYSINREEIFANDGTYLNSKYTINISGSATIKPTDDSSALVKGKRHSRVYGEKIIKLQFNRNQFPMLGNGTLEINAYGDPSGESTTNQIKFYDARLVSVDIPEDTDESAGIHYTEYNFTFEAYNLDDNAMPIDLVSSVEESWDLSENEGEVCFKDGVVQSAKTGDNYVLSIPYKVFTLTHTLSAVGIRKYSVGNLESGDGEAWRQAAKWVEKRIVNDPSDTAIETHINNQTIGPKFVPFFMNTAANKNDLKINLEDINNDVKYKAYNHSRSSSIDISGAGYNVTDTWKVALLDTFATHTLETSIENPVDAQNITVTVNGTVNGLNSHVFSTNKNDAFANAEGELNKVLQYSFYEADRAYNAIPSVLMVEEDGSNPRTGLNNKIIKKSVGKNKNTGSITWSVTYNNNIILSIQEKNNEDLLYDDVIISEDISLGYSNEDSSVNTIALIPVLGRELGPVRQKFDTNKQKTLNISIDFMINTAAYKVRHDPTGNIPPTQYTNPILRKYWPQFEDEIGSPPISAFVNSRTESWNKKTGAYNLTIEWIYK